MFHSSSISRQQVHLSEFELIIQLILKKSVPSQFQKQLHYPVVTKSAGLRQIKKGLTALQKCLVL
jgi:hypothetical protein